MSLCFYSAGTLLFNFAYSFVCDFIFFCIILFFDLNAVIIEIVSKFRFLIIAKRQKPVLFLRFVGVAYFDREFLRRFLTINAIVQKLPCIFLHDFLAK